MNINFINDLKKEIIKKKSYICVGLDSDYEIIPSLVKKNKSISEAIFDFNTSIIDSTNDLVSVYKLNNSFYAAYGNEGLEALLKTNNYIKNNFPNIKIIADCKRSEMNRSAEMVVKELFGILKFDAFTVTPWFGYDTLAPYTKIKGKAVFVLCHDSNKSAVEIQDLKISKTKRVYEEVARLVNEKWNQTGNILIEAPLTYPTALRKIYEISGKDQFFLIAGLGAQGGKISDLKIFSKTKNFIVNASRSIIFASNNSNFALAARNKVKEYNAEIAKIFQEG